jgi:DNA-binding MarR family transcriptional regulator
MAQQVITLATKEMNRQEDDCLKSGSTKTRQELLQRVGVDLGREISAHSLFFHEVVARKLGLNATDTRCLDLIAHAGETQLTAGDLGKSTGLTTGAVTGILDRLEKAGMVTRERDSKDRRKVFVRPKREAMGRVAALYDGLGAAMMKLATGYKTSELDLINGFLERNLALLKEQLAKLS